MLWCPATARTASGAETPGPVAGGLQICDVVVKVAFEKQANALHPWGFNHIELGVVVAGTQGDGCELQGRCEHSFCVFLQPDELFGYECARRVV